MMQKALQLASVFLLGSVESAPAQDAGPVQGERPPHPRTFELKERIRGQRAQIVQALKDNTIPQQHAQNCGNVLDGVESDLKAESAANGPHVFMRMEAFDAYNTRLDMNSAFIREKKQTYYYYDTYYDQHGYVK
jgi:hypothetical protein